MSKFKIGDKVLITSNDQVPTHYHPIGSECTIVSKGSVNYGLDRGGIFQFVSSLCFKLKRPINLENK